MSMISLISILILSFLIAASNSQTCDELSIVNALKNCVENDSLWKSIDKTNSNANLIDIIRLIQIINNFDEYKSCFKSSCNTLLNSCEFKININESFSFNSDSLAASRLASLLTGYTFNEASDSKVYLNLNQLYSLLEFSLLDNDNVYDVRLIFKDQKSFNLRAFKTNKRNFIFY